jgi:hypothetical protein
VAESENPDERKQEAKLPDASVAQPATPRPQQPPATPNTDSAGGDPKLTEPILVRLIGGDDLKPFEQQTIAIARETMSISRRTYWVAVFGFLAALAAAVFVGTQVYEMTKQTQILASQSEGANAAALMDEMNTRRQLGIVQQLATATGKQAELTGRQFVASQQLIESQRASISVAFASVNNPVTFHDGGLSFVFSVALKNIGGLAANKVKLRFHPYFSQWGENIFSEPMRQQRDFCKKPNLLRLRPDLRDLRGLTSDDALTIIPGETKEWPINFAQMIWWSFLTILPGRRESF